MKYSLYDTLTVRYLPGNKLQSLMLNLTSMYIRFASLRSMNGVQSQLFTLLYATSQTTYDLQFIPFWKSVKDSSTH